MFKRLFIVAFALWLAAGFVFGQRTRVRETDKEVREMADARWIASGGINNVASWNDTGNWSIAAVPGASHDVIFDGLDSVASVDGGTASNAAVVSIRTLSNYPGNIGVPGNPLIIDPDIFIIEGSGSIIYSKVGAVDPTQVSLNSPNLVDALRVTNVPTSGVLWVSVLSGKLLAGGTTVDGFTRINIVGGGISSALVEIETQSWVIADLIQSTGFLSLNSQATTAHVSGGEIFVEGSGRIVTLYCSGGAVTHSSQIVSVPTSIFISGGVVDFANVATTKTIGLVVIFPGGEFINPNNITVTNLIDLSGSVPLITP